MAAGSILMMTTRPWTPGTWCPDLVVFQHKVRGSGIFAHNGFMRVARVAITTSRAFVLSMFAYICLSLDQIVPGVGGVEATFECGIRSA